MKFWRQVLLFVAYYVLCSYAIAQNQFVFRHIDAITGVSDNVIKGINSLPDGRISIRTQSMLNLYNGATFDYFRETGRSNYTWQHTGYEHEYVDGLNRLWLKRKQKLQLFDLRTNQFVENIEKVITSYGVKNKLADFFIDKSKNLWFLSEENDLSYYDIALRKLISLPKVDNNHMKKFGVPRQIEQDGDTLWILYSKGLLQKWSYKTQKVIVQDERLVGKINEASHALVLRRSLKGDLWLLHHTDLFFYSSLSDRWDMVSSISGLSNFFTCMDVDKNGDVWIGTSQSEIRIVQALGRTVQSFVGMPLTSGGVLVNDISSLYIDDDNGVWVGTLFQGVCYYHASMRKIHLLHTIAHDSPVTNENVRGFLEEPDGTLLIGTINGLFRYFPHSAKMEPVYRELEGKLCMWLYRDSKGRIWIPTFHNGIFCIENGKVRQYEKKGVSIHASPNPNSARTMIEDHLGQLWVSVYGGVGRFDPNNGNIEFLHERHPEIKNLKLGLTFSQMDKETIAVAAEELYFYNVRKDSVWFPSYRSLINSHGAEFNFIYPDRRKLHWISVDGLKVWDESNQRLYEIPVHNDRPNQTVSAILEDATGDIWVSTMNGISKIAVNKNEDGYIFSVTNFGQIDGAGIQGGRFNTGASVYAADGTMYFGGVHGISMFNPRLLVYNTSNHKPIFTGFRVFNHAIKAGDQYNGRVLFEQPINQIHEIKLKYNENFITLEFAGLNYVHPSRSYLRYKMENYDQDWVEVQVDGVGRINYTGVPPGTYIFRVYAANSDKVWGDEYTEIKVVVNPPFWATIWAKALYMLLLVTAVMAIIHYFNRRNQEKIIRQRELEAQIQREELDQFKLNFFTNLSHEFRTPLSLIMTPLDLLAKEVKDADLKNKLLSIYRHSKDLLSMVNQLLDFRKLEVRGETLRLSHGDIVEFLEGIYTTFKPIAESKRLNFSFDGSDDPIYMFFDKDKIVKVMNNLLSNAFKFTAVGGEVRISVVLRHSSGRNYVEIVVSDTGCGIPDGDLPMIFDRFEQAKNQINEQGGSGIGLYLVREYVELHEGRTIVQSEVDKGTSLTVWLPTDLTTECVPSVLSVEQNKQESDNPDGKLKDKKILIVEDNFEFRKFLKSELGKYYQVIEAADGDEGEKLAIEVEPDLILSDMMMPKVNGISMCQKLKHNLQTSHIPIILLTAKMSDEVRMSVYAAGADSYLSKPVVYDVLHARIENLIEQQEMRKKLFHTTIEVTPSSITINSLDEELVQKALQSVERNMDNPQYGVEDLGKDIGLSRGHLYRKLQSITGQSPADFIRAIRLKRAAQLLRDSQLHVTEIAYMVGFNAQKYFNKHFKDTFGITPSEYRNSDKI
ncbi:helix-turn-helix domain-containing protein [Sphingobacterium alkalisoli]|uniref:histidine kinase n=1 Tax=Sphingobacterium alkalisoli TaxID=1874115 RepID=A0A4U0H8L7_9SPHI|nr:ATP-binding protein [Sphingobacterium alkalisoli]TJY68161.1 helix-turn-helix domain-containing protein [Sphingobacterium alkalisoli]GGH08608.1 hybrid sensor histidine kinase/response regulator [Sphingobacterium alkalisoli]